MTLYRLIHIHDIDDYIVPDIKSLGYYTNIENIEDAIAFFVTLPGFCDYPHGFIVSEHELSYFRKNNPLHVYELCFSVHDKNWDYEYENILSIHSTLKSALLSKKKFKEMNKKDNTIFNSTLIKQIWINDVIVDRKSIFWSEGFNTGE